MENNNGPLVGQSSEAANPAALPPDLEGLILSRFDDLVAKGEIIYEPSTCEMVEDQGFKYALRMVPHLLRKPIIPPDAPERKTGKGRNPFLDPDPDFVLSAVGASHLLLLNKYCVYRPSLLLITREFAPQSTGLDAGDLSAAWALLKHFQRRHMVIYNCGYESGSSQGHKHMQLWHYPDERELGFELFPNNAASEVDVTSDIANVPHQHFVLRLPVDVDLGGLVKAYARLLQEVQRAHARCGSGPAYNVVLVKEWMCMIPRRHCGLERGAGANAAAIVGLVWITVDAERDIWSSEYYKYLGIPR